MQANDLSNFTIGKRFYLEAQVGSGSFGDVYLAKDTRTGNHVAVKIEYKNTEIYGSMLEAVTQTY